MLITLRQLLEHWQASVTFDEPPSREKLLEICAALESSLGYYAAHQIYPPIMVPAPADYQ